MPDAANSGQEQGPQPTALGRGSEAVETPNSRLGQKGEPGAG